MMLYKLLAECDRGRFAPIVVSLINRGALKERIEELGITVETVEMKPGLPSPFGLWRLVKLLRRLKPDLAVGWMYHSCLAAQLANVFLPKRVPVLWSIHYSISSLGSEKKLTAAVVSICARISKSAAQLIFVSQASQTQHAPLGYELAKSCVIPNGINVTEFVPSLQARSSVRSELRLAEGSILIGMMGRYHAMKDHQNFLNAAALISKQYPEAHFVLIGRGVDKKNRVLLEQIQEAGLMQQTHLLGERSDMARLTAALDIFSLSSAYGESFPNVIGEAMACEVPCVVTDVGDSGFMVGDAGRVVPPRDPHALAEAWKEMIGIGHLGRAVLGRKARARVIELFTLESVVSRYEELYEDVLARDASSERASPVNRLVRMGNLNTSLHDTGAG